MNEFTPVNIENGSYKRIKVEPFPFYILTGLQGPKIEELLHEAEAKGYLTIPLKKRSHSEQRLRHTYLDRCRKKKQIHIEVFVDDEWNRVFVCFDLITLDSDQQEFLISEMILSKELNTYYEGLSEKERGRIYLPAFLNPYTHSRHKTNFFILPKQICFSFYQNQPEIFRFVLRKLQNKN